MDPTTGKPSQSNLESVLADYLCQVDAGVQVDRAALIAGHPEIADELRAYFEQEQRIAPIASPSETVAMHGTSTPGRRLQVRCPHCHAPLELAVDTPLTDLTCDSCGSHFSLVDGGESTRSADTLTQLGRFELVERLGMGGFGSVWKARDKELDRTVAIKLPRRGDMDAAEAEKFLREARAAAQLRHPNIVPVHEVGRDGDTVYIVSDFVRGVTLGDWASGQQLTGREVAEIGAKIAEALHHAHQQGVIHRDLKPANIMVDGSGDPHLMDFGLARREAGEVTVTVEGQVLGTPAYMSPEQALGEAHKADRRSDIYSLGVILFQLLTGELPFRGNARMLIHQVINDEPPSPRKLNASVPRDLETITLKCLEKSPSKRYHTAADVSNELHRFVIGEPIEARPIGQLQRTWRSWRQHPIRLLLIVLLGMLLILCVVGYAYMAVSEQRDLALDARNKSISAEEVAEEQRQVAEQQRFLAEQQRQRAKQAEADALKQKEIAESLKLIAEEAKAREEYEAYVAQIGLIDSRIRVNEYKSAARLLQQTSQQLRNWEWGRLAYLCNLSDATWKLGGPVEAIAYTPDGRYFATADRAGKVILWDWQSRKPIHEFSHGQYIHSVAFDPSGERFASGSSDRTIHVYRVSDGKLTQKLVGHIDGVTSVRFNANGQKLLSCSFDKTAIIWDLDTGMPIQHLKGHAWWVWSAEFSPDNQRIVTAGQDGKAIVWQKLNDDGRYGILTEFLKHRGSINAARFAPDGKLVATGGGDGRVLLWNPDEVLPVDIARRMDGLSDPPAPFRELAGHQKPVNALEFSPDGSQLASGGEDNVVRLWDLPTGEQLAALRGHASYVRDCTFSPDGSYILSAGRDKQVKLWNLTRYGESLALGSNEKTGHKDAVLDARFSNDGRQIVTASQDRTARLWDTVSISLVKQFSEGHQYLASNAVFFPNGKGMVTSAGDGTTCVWNVATGTQIDNIVGTGRTCAIDVSHDGRWLATAGTDNDVQIWDLSSKKLMVKLQGHAAAISALRFSPDGRKLASGDERGICRSWQRKGDRWNVGTQFGGHSRAVTGLAFTAHGRLISASRDNTCTQWNLDTGEEILPLVLKHPGSVNGLDVSDAGFKAITICDDGIVRLWSLEDAKLLRTIHPSKNVPYTSVDISPDGSLAVAVSAAVGSVQMWRLDTGEEISVEEEPWLTRGNISGMLWSAKFSPAGDQLLTIGGNEAQLWDIESRERITRFAPHGSVASADISPDGQLLVSGSWDRSAKIWDVATGKAIRKLDEPHERFINSVEFSPNGRLVLTASDDGTGRFWRVDTGETVPPILEGHSGRLSQARFSIDGSKVLTTSGDKTARIWDAKTGKTLLILKGHQRGVLCGNFSPSAERVITGGEDDEAIIWNATTGEILLKLSGHSASVTGVAFSPDGSRVLTGSRDGLCKLWDARAAKEILTLNDHDSEITSASFSPDGFSVLTSDRKGNVTIWPSVDWNQPFSEASDEVARQKRRRSERWVELNNTPSLAQSVTLKHKPSIVSALRDIPANFSDYEPTQAHQITTYLEVKLARLVGNKEGEIEALERLENLLRRQAKVSEQQFQRGRFPFTKEHYLKQRTRYCRAKSTAARSRGDAQTERIALVAGIRAAELWVETWEEEYLQQKARATDILEPLEQLTWHRIRLAELDEDSKKKAAALQTAAETIEDVWRAVHALYESARRGGEAYIEATLRAKMHEAHMHVAEELGNSQELLRYSEQAKEAALTAALASRAEFVASKVSLDQHIAALELKSHLAAHHASLTGNQIELVGAFVGLRNETLDLWRGINARHEAGRRGGEAHKRFYAASQYFLAIARLYEFAESINEESSDFDFPALLRTPAGSLPRDRTHGAKGAKVEAAYGNALLNMKEAVKVLKIEAAAKGYFFDIGNSLYRPAPGEQITEIRRIDEYGIESELTILKNEALNNLQSLFGKLPDGHYVIYSVRTDNNSERLVIDVYIRQGRAVDPAAYGH